jgi:hypothetical protein
MRYITTLILLLATPAFAGNATLTWQEPTGTEQCTNTSETPVLASTQIWQLVATLPVGTTEYTFEGLEPGEYTYTASVTDTEGRVSRLSNGTTKTVDTFSVIDERAFTLIQSGGNLVALVVGTVPLGTACNVNSMVRGQFNFENFTGYSVPLESVTITGNTEPVMVVAQCG